MGNGVFLIFIATADRNRLDGAPDPVPQAMVLTAIVIGVGVQALALTLVIRIRQRYGTLDVQEARRRMQAELEQAAGVTPSRSDERPAGERPLPAPPAIADAGGRHD